MLRLELCCDRKLEIRIQGGKQTLPFTARCRVCGRWFDVSRRTVLNSYNVLKIMCDLNYAKKR